MTSRRPKLVLAGIVGRYPVGGVTWCALHYLAGFQDLGYDVLYIEDTGECPYDPTVDGITTDPSYSLRYIQRSLEMVGMGDRWAYVDHTGRFHGWSRKAVAEFCGESMAFVNLSGGCWFHRPEYEGPLRIFVDTDPGFTQRAIAEAGEGWYRDFFESQDALFTFALNIESPSCAIAATPFEWRPTIQPLVLRFWPVLPPPPDAPYTSILSWRIDSFPGMGKGKSKEIFRWRDLPARTPKPIRLAIAGRAPEELLRRHGWDLTDAVEETRGPLEYRDFIQRSRAEIGFAKAMYVETRSGWFSDRTECYLASGRPALVRDTGLSDHLPVGEGLLVFTDDDEIVEGMERIESDYPAHARKAREIAEERFEAEAVLTRLLRSAGIV